ncbi:hypothetical protein Tco_0963829 [Tanacetum coccineum]
MRYTRHKRMINGDVGVKNGIFIPDGEKIRRINAIREKSKKDPYNISEERRFSSPTARIPVLTTLSSFLDENGSKVSKRGSWMNEIENASRDRNILN